MATRQKLIHIHSNVYENGAAKAPTTSHLEYGEIAVNYNATEPSLFMRDVNDNIKQISTNDTIAKLAKLGDSYEAVEYRQLTASDIVFNPVVADDTLTEAIGKLDTNLSTLVGEVVDIELATSEALNVLRQDIDTLESDSLTEEDVQEIVSGMQSTLIPGTFISIDESNNINVKTGTTSSTVAVGNHSHGEFNTLQTNINTLSGNVNTLSGNVNTLKNNFTNSATTLNNAITAETSNRQTADTTLQNDINTLSGSVVSNSNKITNIQNAGYITTAATVANANNASKVSNALTFGSKTYNGSSSQTITASDLGALTSHQAIYNLTMQAGAFTATTFDPNSADKTVKIPTQTSHLNNDSGFINSGATVANANAVTYMTGHTSVTSLTNIPISKRLVICTVSASGSFSVKSTPSDGREIHVMVNNTGSADITITLPTASPYVNLTGDSITLAAGGWAEINVLSDGTNRFLRAL